MQLHSGLTLCSLQGRVAGLAMMMKSRTGCFKSGKGCVWKESEWSTNELLECRIGQYVVLYYYVCRVSTELKYFPNGQVDDVVQWADSVTLEQFGWVGLKVVLALFFNTLLSNPVISGRSPFSMHLRTSRSMAL